MSKNPHIIDHIELMRLTGYEKPGMVAEKLREQGIRPFYGRAGYFFITLEMLNAARGIFQTPDSNSEELL